MILDKHPDNDRTGCRAIGYWRVPLNKNTEHFRKLLGWPIPDGYDRELAHAALPNPADYVDETWDSNERVIVARYLRAGENVCGYRGSSTCRICGFSPNGSCDLSDGVFVWPDGFAHYIEEHAVRPPAEFIEHARSQGVL